MTIKLEKLEELKSNGIMAIASVVKSHFRTTYYHVVYIDELMKKGRRKINE